MNKFSFYVLSLLGILLITITSCEKENVVAPIPESGCTTCTCIEFDGTGLTETFTSTTYGSVFYYQSNASMKGRYSNYSGQGNNVGSIEVIPVTSTLQNANPKFSGEALKVLDADLLLDYSTDPISYKQISFDLNVPLSDVDIKIDGVPLGSVSHLRRLFNNGGSTVLMGSFSTIEIGGGDFVIDNICVSHKEIPDMADSTAITFEGHSALERKVSRLETTFMPIRESKIYSIGGGHESVFFNYKYANYTGVGDTGTVFFGHPNAGGADFNINFDGTLLKLHNCDLEVDLSSLSFTDKHVYFDIANTWNITNPNEFEVNGAPLGTVPSGVSYHVIPLGIANNGNVCYRVIIEGAVNRLILKGNETFYDNLFVQPI